MTSTVLIALKGETGAQGAQGVQGVPGPQGATGNATWGGISGTLSAQSDLQTALNNKITVGSESDPQFNNWLSNLSSASLSVSSVSANSFYGDGSGLYNVSGGSSNPQYLYDGSYYYAIDGYNHTANCDYYAGNYSNSAVFSWYNLWLDMYSHDITNVLGIYGYDGMTSYWSINQYGNATFQSLTLGSTSLSEADLILLLALI
jgi:hypothetical protein